MKKLLSILTLTFVIVTVGLSATSCDDDEYYWGEPSWFYNRQFVAQSNTGNFWWYLTLYNDGTFTVDPVDNYGYDIEYIEAYAGNYTITFDPNRIYVSYYGYSMNSMWTFEDDGGSGRYAWIYTAPGTGPLDNLVFEPNY